MNEPEPEWLARMLRARGAANRPDLPAHLRPDPPEELKMCTTCKLVFGDNATLEEHYGETDHRYGRRLRFRGRSSQR